MIVLLTPEAEFDLDEAHSWYLARGRGLGDDFLRTFEASIAFIERFPKLYQAVYGDIRQAPLRRFPYSLLYAPDKSNQIWVHAVFHSSRDPSIWKRRVAP